MSAKNDAGTGPQHLIDVAHLWVAIRRGRRLWLTFALLGMLAGAAFAVVLPPAPTATTRILVVHEQESPADGGSLIRTDAALMASARVAARALEKLGVDERPEDFLQQFEVVGLTNNILEVSVEGPTGAEAARRAEALAEVFIADHIGRIQAGADAQAKAIIGQRARTQADLDGVNGQISGAEAAAAANQDSADPARPNAANLDSLYARRAELTDQISQLTQQAQEAALGAPRAEAGTQIVDAPRPVRVSLKATLATNAGLGLVLGLILGITCAAVIGVVRDKPVLRRDIATHLGASVIAELRRRSPFGRRADKARRRAAATLVRLVRDATEPVSVLELGAGPLAAALATDLAAELAEDRPVVLVADPAERVTAVPTGTPHPVRLLGADDPSRPVPGEARIGVGSVAPGTAWTDLPHLGAETLLVVRAGYANTAWLHTVARQLADVGVPIVGVVLADPDPRDKSDGTLWDGLRTALRGRAKHKKGVNGTNGHDLPTKRFAPVRPANNKG